MDDKVIKRVIVINKEVSCTYEGFKWEWDIQQISENDRASFLIGKDENGKQMVSISASAPIVIEYR
jgi:hypothetical protein